jgi:hypothetical protein
MVPSTLPGQNRTGTIQWSANERATGPTSTATRDGHPIPNFLAIVKSPMENAVKLCSLRPQLSSFIYQTRVLFTNAARRNICQEQLLWAGPRFKVEGWTTWKRWPGATNCC